MENIQKSHVDVKDFLHSGLREPWLQRVLCCTVASPPPKKLRAMRVIGSHPNCPPIQSLGLELPAGLA